MEESALRHLHPTLGMLAEALKESGAGPVCGVHAFMPHGRAIAG